MDDFLADPMRQDAVARNLEVLGEASKQLHDVLPDAPSRFPAIPFPSIYALRNRLIHAYSFANYQTIYELGARDIPVLREALASTLAAWPADLVPLAKNP